MKSIELTASTVFWIAAYFGLLAAGNVWIAVKKVESPRQRFVIYAASLVLFGTGFAFVLIYFNR